VKTERKQEVMNILTQLVTEDKSKVTFRFLLSKSQVICNIFAGIGNIQGRGENGLAALSEAFRYYVAYRPSGLTLPESTATRREVRRKDRENFVNKMSLLAKQRVKN